MKFFRRFVYRKILDHFPLLQKSVLTISREGFSVFYHKVKRKLKQYLWRFIYVDRSLITYPSETATSKTYIRPGDFQMKADKEVIRNKLRAIIEEIKKK
jgi:hypothetical protein